MTATCRLGNLLGHLRRPPGLHETVTKQGLLARASTSAAQATAIKDSYKIVIVGGGNASGYACMELIGSGIKSHEVAMITEEPVPPYERPALTKAYMHPPEAKVRARLPGFYTCAGWGKDKQTLQWYTDHGIDVLTETKVTKIDAKNCSLKTNTGISLTYEKLLFATGTRAIMANEIGLEDSFHNLFTVRSEKDAADLVSYLETSEISKAVVIGGGYIGMECAAILAGWKNVQSIDMVFPESHLMERLFPVEVADWMEENLKKRGINIIKGVTVEKTIGGDGVLTAVQLSNGSVIETNLVIAGLGAKPNSELLQGQVNISSDGGIEVDECLRSSNSSIFSCGDAASFPHKYFDDQRHMRFEHIDNCRLSAVHAAKSMLGKPEAYVYVPFFYSRLFEYGAEPVVFNFYGNQLAPDGSQLDLECFSDTLRIGAFWLDSKRVVRGALICNGSQENYEEISMLVKNNTVLEKGRVPASLLKSW